MTTTPAPTQQMREKFEAECIRLELTEYLISKDPFRKTGEGEYYFDLIGELEQLWQSAHQCGREEERARILSILHSEWKWFSYNAEAPHKELKSAIERIQGGK